VATAEAATAMTNSEIVIAEGKRRTGRECGSCSLCCYVLDIDELNKPTHAWCQHCRPGKGGCSIYADRPPVCRDFACKWLTDASLPEHWFPKRAHMVIHKPTTSEMSIVEITVDRRYPNRWREEPYYSDIRQIALNGLSNGIQFATRVVVGEQSWLILPHREVEFADGDYGVVVPVGPDKFEWIKTKSKAHGEQLIASMKPLVAEARRNPALVAELQRLVAERAG
jgi:hypothetical protein